MITSLDKVVTVLGVKDFFEWLTLKQRLHESHHKPPIVREGEIWWASLGSNIGFEIDGKSKLFTRPVIIYKRLSRGFYFIVPVTSRQRKGSWYVPFHCKGRPSSACLHQARAIDYRRIFSRIGTTNAVDLDAIKKAFGSLYEI